MSKLSSQKEYSHVSSINEQNDDKQKIIFEFMKIINSEEKILIYGAGNVAKRLYKEFDKCGQLTKIKAFIVSNKENNANKLYEISVSEYTNFIKTPEKIIIGLWKTKQDEIYHELVKNGVNKNRIIKLPSSVNEALEFLYRENRNWEGSEKYWEDRYKSGGNSGAGSYNRLAKFKAEIINQFVSENKINSVIEWGCGDGNQLLLSNYNEYIGYDVSKEAIDICYRKYEGDKTKKFIWCGEKNFVNEFKADLTLSLDVIYHLVEDEVYRIYMDRLFYSSLKYVCIYSCDFDNNFANHVRCRNFTDYIRTNYKKWNLIKYIPNKYPYDEKKPDDTSWSEFFFYQKEV